MRDYNGFPAKQRDKAQRWLNKHWDAGSLARPSRCVACGQSEGVIDAHAEDYSEPFAPGKTDEFHLCFVCHMMVHCRHKNEPRWAEYRGVIEAGARAHAFYRRDWPRFQKHFLSSTILAGDLFIPAPVQIGKPLLQIELSQDEVAQRLRAGHKAIPRR